MSEKVLQSLGGVSETLLMTLYARARESQRSDPMLKDDRAVEMVNQIACDFSRLRMHRHDEIAAIMRVRKFDNYVRDFLKRNPGYVFDFIQGDSKTFDYGVDYLECASCKFLAKQGAPELAPYLFPVDILYSEILGWGLTRTMTLAEGAEKCDFRFKRGGSTNVTVRPGMRELVDQK